MRNPVVCLRGCCVDVLENRLRPYLGPIVAIVVTLSLTTNSRQLFL